MSKLFRQEQSLVALEIHSFFFNVIFLLSCMPYIHKIISYWKMAGFTNTSKNHSNLQMYSHISKVDGLESPKYAITD